VAEQPEQNRVAGPAAAPQQQSRPAQPAPVRQPEPQPTTTPQPSLVRPREPQQAAPVADNVFAPRVPVAPQEEDASGEPGRELTVDLAVEALVAFQESFGHDPDPDRLAQYLFTQYGATGRRPGAPASRNEMSRIWPLLQDRYATLGRD
jgi:hypothetical protein